MKTCPWCRESIQDAAVICKHCHKRYPPPAPVIDYSKRNRQRLIACGVVLVLLFVCTMIFVLGYADFERNVVRGRF